MVALGRYNWAAFGREFQLAEQDRRRIARLEGVRESVMPNKAVCDLCTAIMDGEVTARDYSIRRVFESLVPDGREIVNTWQGNEPGRGVSLIRESINTSAFANINQTFLHKEVLAQFDKPELIARMLVDIIPTSDKWERIPGVGQLGDQAAIVKEGDNYPYATLSEDWIQTQETEKRGVIVPVTKEAIFFDKTGLVLQRATQVAEWLAINWEKRILDTVLGIVDRYDRKSRGLLPTYGTATGGRDWVNTQANPLIDHLSIEDADLLFDDIVDYDTGEPIVIGEPQMLVPKALLATARRIINATEIVTGTRDVSDVGFGTQTKSDNPYRGRMPDPISNQYVANRSSSNTTWWYGDFKKAFKYYENWAPQAVTAPTNNDDEFERDIAVKTKISEMGQVAVVQPRAVQRNTAT